MLTFCVASFPIRSCSSLHKDPSSNIVCIICLHTIVSCLFIVNSFEIFLYIDKTKSQLDMDIDLRYLTNVKEWKEGRRRKLSLVRNFICRFRMLKISQSHLSHIIKGEILSFSNETLRYDVLLYKKPIYRQYITLLH